MTQLSSIAISFQIMTRAEPTDLVKATIDSLLAIKAPQDEIIIIDNNHTNKALYQPLEKYCQSLKDTDNVRFVHQDYISGYKAGALNLALEMMNKACQYIVVVDSDYQAMPWARNHIIEAIKSNPNHALLQFPQHYRDTDKPDIHSELNHYFSYHLRRNFNRNLALSTGTFAVIKKDILLALGGWSGESITEDAQMGVLMHQSGAKSKFIPEVIATGVLPQTLTDLMGQRRRWIYGNMQVLLSYPRLLASGPFLTSPSAEDGITGKSQLEPLNLTSQLAHIRAHLSQLSAWVNFTGGFIGLQSIAVGMLVSTSISGQEALVSPALTLLGISYLGYGVYLGRRLIAYLKDDSPLTLESLQNTVKVTRPSSLYQSSFESLLKTAPAKRHHIKAKDSLFSVTSRFWAKKTHGLKKLRARLWATSRHSQTSRHVDNFAGSAAHQSTAKQSIRTHDSHSAPNSQDIPTDINSISQRLKAWLVHINFWELGALSWVPVLWGQQKPFVCTPKLATSQLPFRSLIDNIIATPKLLIGLNTLTAILVLHRSPLLLSCAIAIVSIKLAASWVVIDNFVSSINASDETSAQAGDISDKEPLWPNNAATWARYYNPESLDIMASSLYRPSIIQSKNRLFKLKSRPDAA
ncbi:MAG: glycosyltransferase [Psychrobacter sp.]|nr:glycosyltransferase [Psychrobacter sp.]